VTVTYEWSGTFAMEDLWADARARWPAATPATLSAFLAWLEAEPDRLYALVRPSRLDADPVDRWYTVDGDWDPVDADDAPGRHPRQIDWLADA
jgi:hypothetical protein